MKIKPHKGGRTSLLSIMRVTPEEKR